MRLGARGLPEGELKALIDVLEFLRNGTLVQSYINCYRICWSIYTTEKWERQWGAFKTQGGAYLIFR